MYKSGDVILALVQYADTFEVKQRPAVVLYVEHGNIVIAGITSNTAMDGIPLTKEEGAVKESVIKVNYIFTIAGQMAIKKLFSLSPEKKRQVYFELEKRIAALN